jgi:hypothetical protein
MSFFRRLASDVSGSRPEPTHGGIDVPQRRLRICQTDGAGGSYQELDGLKGASIASNATVRLLEDGTWPGMSPTATCSGDRSCLVGYQLLTQQAGRPSPVGKRNAVREERPAAGHITSSRLIRPRAATFAALKRFPEADPTHGGWLILPIGEACLSGCRLSDCP